MNQPSVLLAEFRFNGGFEPRYVATSPWYSKTTDSIGRREYLGRIAEEPTIRTVLSCYVWGGTSATTIGAMSCIDIDGELIEWLGLEYRDAVCVLRLAYPGQSYDETVVMQVCIVDDIDKTETGITVRLRGMDTLLDLPMQSVLYDSTVPSAALEGQPLPINIGYFRQVDPVAYDRVGLEFRVSDSGLGGLTAVMSGGSPATGPGPSDQWDYNAPRFDGFTLSVSPSAKLLVDGGGGQAVDASMFEPASIAVNFADPDNWDSGLPLNWSYVATGGVAYTITEVPGVGLRFSGTTETAKSRTLIAPAELPGNAWYVLVGKVARNNGGALLHGNSGRVISSEGRFSIIWFETGGGDLTISHDPDQLGGLDVTLEYLECYSLSSSIENMVQFIEHCAIVRGGFLRSELQLNDYITDGFPYPIVGYSNADNRTVRQVVNTSLNAVCGWSWFSPAGRLKIGCLRIPDHSPGEESLVASRLNIVGGYPVFTPDMAPGLSDTVAGARNWVQYTDEELAGITYEDREPFKVDYRIKRKTDQVLRRSYRHAIGAKPAESFMQDATEVQTEANRVGDIYATRRSSSTRLGQPGFWAFQIAMPDDLSAIGVETNQLIRLEGEDLFGVYAGLNAIIVDKGYRARNNIIQVLVWTCP